MDFTVSSRDILHRAALAEKLKDTATAAALVRPQASLSTEQRAAVDRLVTSLQAARQSLGGER